MNQTVQLVDSAIGSLKAARDTLYHDRQIQPADLAAMIAATRELAWTIDALVNLTANTYRRQHAEHHYAHDNHSDPGHAVGQIIEQLERTRQHLDAIEACLSVAHDHANKLHRNNTLREGGASFRR